MTVEVALRRENDASPARELVQVHSVCKYTGGGFLAAVEIDVPAGRRFGRVRPVTFANG